MKFISWNVNGLRACVTKGFLDFFRETDADIFCIQETKLQEGQISLELEGYHQYWNYAEKKGYSGTAIFTKEEPEAVLYGIGIEEHDREGRVITLEYPGFYFVTVYTPNSQNELARLDYRMKWEEDFIAYLKKLEEKKIIVGYKLIVVSKGNNTQLEIIDPLLFLQPDYPEFNQLVIGIAKGYDSALEIVETIFRQVYDETGGTDIRSYILCKEMED